MTDKITDSSKQAAPISNHHLLADFLAAHQTSGGRSGQDVQDCRDAQNTDRDTITALSGGHVDKAKLTGLLQTDIQQDQQAAGNGQKDGADQKNAALADRIVALDKMMQANPNLSDAQRQALGADMATHSLDAQFSRGDIATEQQYVAHDQALIQALKTGKGVEKAMAAVAADRRHDIAMEDKYVSNDQSMNVANQTVLKLFGKPQLH